MSRRELGKWLDIYKYGSTGVKIGNRGVTTALAVKAIAASVDILMGIATEQKSQNV